jgi:hypothetical protein
VIERAPREYPWTVAPSLLVELKVAVKTLSIAIDGYVIRGIEAML